jgi:hypothetical protein
VGAIPRVVDVCDRSLVTDFRSRRSNVPEPRGRRSGGCEKKLRGTTEHMRLSVLTLASVHLLAAWTISSEPDRSTDATACAQGTAAPIDEKHSREPFRLGESLFAATIVVHRYPVSLFLCQAAMAKRSPSSASSTRATRRRTTE